MLPRVTIVWRPNVGKSSLFNIISGHKIAIISDQENTTRDIIEYELHDAENEISYVLADSGWLVYGNDESILQDVRVRVDEAIESSDIILFILEYDKITEFDEVIAKKLRKSHKTILLVANKADNKDRALESYNLLSLWFEDVFPTSPVQHRWIDALKIKIAEILKAEGYKYTLKDEEDTSLKLAIIGRPNVGKSSIVNAISWKTRSIVKDLPGTTRDAIDTLFTWNNEEFCLIDTAGIRRSGKIWSANIEQWSVLRAERSISRADVVAVVIDAFEWVAHQDQHIVSKALEEKKGIILVVNKWDKVLSKPDVWVDTILERYMRYLSKKFDFLSYVPVVFTSAIDGKRIDKILEHAIAIRKERNKRVKTGVFNQFLSQITYEHAPTGSRKSHKPKVYYWSQVDVNPPRFLVSVNNSDHFHFSYLRYMENKIREFFGFEWTPIDLELRSRKSMYKKWEEDSN